MRRALAFALLLAVPILAGCVQSPPAGPGAGTAPSAAHLRCLDDNSTRRCNFLATASPQQRQANELSIAVNPRDPDNIIVSGKDYTPDYAGDCVWDGVYATKDGGKTWKDQNVPGSPWKRLQDPTEPLTPVSNFWCVTDPVVAFDGDGNAFWAIMPYQCDAASGGKTGKGIIPANPLGQGGGLNDWFWTCSSMYVMKSTDGGLTWPVDAMKQVDFGPRLQDDKGWLSVSPSGKLLYCWDHAPPTGPAADNAPAPDVPGSPPLDDAVVCSVSTDHGGSWSELHDMTVGWSGGIPWVDWRDDDNAYAALTDDKDVIVTHSKDGLTWDKPSIVAPYKNPPANAEYGWPGLNGSKFRIFTLPSLAIDRSHGPHAGRMYATWMTFNETGKDADVVLSWSDDGQRWSAPQRVHDDDPALHVDQFMPAVSVGPDGTVDVSFHDRRWDPQHHLFDLAYTYSTDGGVTWAPNLRVSEVSSDEQYSHHQNGAVFLGDYRDSDSGPGFAALEWVDTRNHKADVFVAIVERPGANAGLR